MERKLVVATQYQCNLNELLAVEMDHRRLPSDRCFWGLPLLLVVFMLKMLVVSVELLFCLKRGE